LLQARPSFLRYLHRALKAIDVAGDDVPDDIETPGDATVVGTGIRPSVVVLRAIEPSRFVGEESGFNKVDAILGPAHAAMVGCIDLATDCGNAVAVDPHGGGVSGHQWIGRVLDVGALDVIGCCQTDERVHRMAASPASPIVEAPPAVTEEEVGIVAAQLIPFAIFPRP